MLSVKRSNNLSRVSGNIKTWKKWVFPSSFRSKKGGTFMSVSDDGGPNFSVDEAGKNPSPSDDSSLTSNSSSGSDNNPLKGKSLRREK